MLDVKMRIHYDYSQNLGEYICFGMGDGNMPSIEFGVGAIFSLIGSHLELLERDLPKMNFYQLEKHSDVVVKEFGQKYMQLISNLREKAIKPDKKKPKCTICKKNMPCHRSGASRKIASRYGEVEIYSDYFYCRSCKVGLRPHDNALGLKAEAPESPRLEELVCLFGKDYSFERASDMLMRTVGIQISDNTVRRITESKGLDLVKYIEKQVDDRKLYPDIGRHLSEKESEKKAGTVYLEVDGSYVPMRGEYREAKLVCSFEEIDRYEPSKDRPLLLNKAYNGKIAQIEEFSKIFEHHVRTNSINHAERVVVLGDGAEWIWNLVKVHIKDDRIEILDYYHASEYIWDFSKVWCSNEIKASQLATDLETILYEKSGEDVLARLNELRTSNAEKRAALNTITTYYRNNFHRMTYAKYREMGLIIGSGAVEGGNKNVIHTRCRQAGMHWSVDGANSIIALRCLFESDSWDKLQWGAAKSALAA